MLAEVAREVGFQDTKVILIPLLEPILSDPEQVVRIYLAEQIRLLATFCMEHDEKTEGSVEGYQLILNNLLPITARLLEDSKQEVRYTACYTFLHIAKLIKPEDIGQHVLTVVLLLAHDDDKDEMRITASHLLNLLCDVLGPDLCKQFVIPEVMSLSEDPSLRVRKSTALNFENVCKVGGEQELFERLIPAFVKLSKDEIFRVRRACAESLPQIAKNVVSDIRFGVLGEIFLRLAHDTTKQVRFAVLYQSGFFLATLSKNLITSTYLQQYISLSQNPLNDSELDPQLQQVCAYTFPAVLLALGKERWSEVRDLYNDLFQSEILSIKRTLAYSLHEIAKILDDPKLVEEELLPVFEDLIQCDQSVQMGVFKYLAAFLKTLPELCACSYLPMLSNMIHQTHAFNWRLRQHLAVQLPELVMLPPKHEVFNIMFLTVITLLQDPVVSVRKDSLAGVAQLLLITYNVSINKDNLYTEEQVNNNIANLEKFCSSLNYFVSFKSNMRQIWVDLCAELLKTIPLSLFASQFLPSLLKLASDPVTIVRIAVSDLLTAWTKADYPAPWEFNKLEEHELIIPKPKSDDINHIDLDQDNSLPKLRRCPSSQEYEGYNSPWQWLLARKDIRDAVVRLSDDCRDVYHNIVKLQPLFPDLEFKIKSCRGLKEAPGGSEPVSVNDTLLTRAEIKELYNIYSTKTYKNAEPDAQVVSEVSHETGTTSSHHLATLLSVEGSEELRSSFSNETIDENVLGIFPRFHVSSRDDDDGIVTKGVDVCNLPIQPENLPQELDIMDGLVSGFLPNNSDDKIKQETNSDDEVEELMPAPVKKVEDEDDAFSPTIADSINKLDVNEIENEDNSKTTASSD